MCSLQRFWNFFSDFTDEALNDNDLYSSLINKAIINFVFINEFINEKSRNRPPSGKGIPNGSCQKNQTHCAVGHHGVD